MATKHSEAHDQFVDRLEAAMTEQGWRKTHLAEALDVSKTTVGYWLAKRTVPGREYMEKIATVFNKPPEYFDTEWFGAGPSIDLDVLVKLVGGGSGVELSEQEKRQTITKMMSRLPLPIVNRNPLQRSELERALRESLGRFGAQIAAILEQKVMEDLIKTIVAVALALVRLPEKERLQEASRTIARSNEYVASDTERNLDRLTQAAQDEKNGLIRKVASRNGNSGNGKGDKAPKGETREVREMRGEPLTSETQGGPSTKSNRKRSVRR